MKKIIRYPKRRKIINTTPITTTQEVDDNDEEEKKKRLSIDEISENIETLKMERSKMENCEKRVSINNQIMGLVNLLHSKNIDHHQPTTNSEQPQSQTIIIDDSPIVEKKQKNRNYNFINLISPLPSNQQQSKQPNENNFNINITPVPFLIHSQNNINRKRKRDDGQEIIEIDMNDVIEKKNKFLLKPIYQIKNNQKSWKKNRIRENPTPAPFSRLPAILLPNIEIPPPQNNSTIIVVDDDDDDEKKNNIQLRPNNRLFKRNIPSQFYYNNYTQEKEKPIINIQMSHNIQNQSMNYFQPTNNHNNRYQYPPMLPTINFMNMNMNIQGGGIDMHEKQKKYMELFKLQKKVDAIEEISDDESESDDDDDLRDRNKNVTVTMTYYERQIYKYEDFEYKELELSKTPKDMKIDLFPHQKLCLTWLLEQEKGELMMPKGGILADEMGLGKTVEIIALLAEKKVKTTLIVCPLSIVDQWHSEIRGKCRHRFKIFKYHGTVNRKRDEKFLERFDIVITTYGTLMNDLPLIIGKPDGALLKVNWDRIILDEGHLIRNAKTRTAKSAHRLIGEVKWVLSGTPIQNSVKDIYSLFKFLGYSPYDDKKVFKKTIEEKIRRGDELAYEHFRKVLKGVFMRRGKKSELDGEPIITLPDRIDYAMEMVFEDRERKLYDFVFKKSRDFYNEFVEEGSVMKNYIFILQMLLRLRQICNHGFLTTHRTRKSFEKMEEDVKQIIFEKSNEEKCTLCDDVIENKVWTRCGDDRNTHAFCHECLQGHISSHGQNCPTCNKHFSMNIFKKTERIKVFKDTFIHSTKTRKLIESLTKVMKTTDDKILIISQWTSFLDLLHFPLEKLRIRGRIVEYICLDGRMKLENRTKEIERMKKSKTCKIALVSMKACGLGLNLNFANRVFMVDQWYNPAVEDQSIDRVHRLGQKKKVYVYRFIIKNTVEQKIMGIKTKKQEVISTVYNEPMKNQTVVPIQGSVSASDIEYLFS